MNVYKPIANVMVKCLPRENVLRRMLMSRVVKAKFSKNLMAASRLCMLKQFSEEAFSSQVICIGTSHMQYGFVPGRLKVPAWNLAVSNCDLRTMYYIAESIYRRNPSARLVVGIDFWLRSLQMEFTRDFPLCSILDSLGIVPLRNRFLAREWNRYGAGHSMPIPAEFSFDRGFWHGLKHYDQPAEERVPLHLRHLAHRPTELPWLAELLALCSRHDSRPIVVFPPAREDYRRCLRDAGDLFADYRGMCKGLKVLDLFADGRFANGDFGDTDHLNELGAAKFTEIINEAI